VKTIRQQLTRKLLIAFAVPTLLGGVLVFLYVRSELVAQFDAALRARAMAIATVTRQRGDRIDVDSSDRFMREFDGPDAQTETDGPESDDANSRDHEPGVPIASAFFQMWRADGTTIERSESLGNRDLTPPERGGARNPRFRNTTLPDGGHGRAVTFEFVPRIPRDQRAATHPSQVVLVVAVSREGLDGRLAMLAAMLSVGGLFLLGATFIVVPRVLRQELNPIGDLAARAERIHAGTLSVRFPTDGLPAELLPISRGLNDLLARLEASFVRERQFSGDVAHELRTPIAELRSLAELALKWPESRDPATDRDTLHIAVHMEGIVTRLLELLRSERGQLAISSETVSLDSLLLSVWSGVAHRAAAKELEVAWDVPIAAPFDTSPVLLRSILMNLIDNAVEYTPAGGHLRVVGRVADARFAVSVSNDVQEIRADDVPKLFDRFWRRDPARSGDGHSGLGLSIARAFAHALGCELTAILEADSRLVFTLSGPQLAR
jgi:two-component system, OmpR family, heavy metal sensor histidine kinase CusS